jgi:hypothetical protein
VVDELGRDQLADAFGLTVVQGVEDRSGGALGGGHPLLLR